MRGLSSRSGRAASDQFHRDPDVHLQDLARVAEELVEVKDALGNLVGSAGEDRAGWLEVGPAGPRMGRPISAEPVWNMRASCSRRRGNRGAPNETLEVSRAEFARCCHPVAVLFGARQDRMGAGGIEVGRRVGESLKEREVPQLFC
jgi:hypothetical protein